MYCPRVRNVVLFLLAVLLCGADLHNVRNEQVHRSISIIWKGGRPAGQIIISSGKISRLNISRGGGRVQTENRFAANREGEFCIEFDADAIAYQEGKRPVVRVATEENPFSFFLSDVDEQYPMIVPAYEVIVTGPGCPALERTENAFSRTRTLTRIQQIENEPEETFERAASVVRNQRVPTWLGLSRDIRIFAVNERFDSVEPKRHAHITRQPDFGERFVRYEFLMGRGWGPVETISRNLVDGVYPILEGHRRDGGIAYRSVAFVSLERSPLTAQNNRGTHFLVADAQSYGHMFTPEQQAIIDSLRPDELNRPEETVFYLRMEAINTSAAPRYAWFRSMTPIADGHPWKFDGSRGFGVFNSGTVFAVARLNGRPLPNHEVAVLLKPGESARVEIALPHAPVTEIRATELAGFDFDRRLQETRAYWQEKLDHAARVILPEQRLNDMIAAGVLHLDLITYGLEPDGTLAPTIGNYSPIGSESSPIIQFMDSMGRHDVARRSLMYFLDKQHENGFIQNFGEYMLETGAALWSLGEHYRYTRDDEWVRQIKPKLIKSAEFILDWRRRNLREDLRGKGYGLLEGKTADPEDPFRSFMLNGYHYLGLQRVAEMLQNVDPETSELYFKEASAFRSDIRTALFEDLAASPLVPLGDGTWSPSVPPWVGYSGPVVLYADGGEWYTHGAMPLRDSILGPLYLIFQEVIDPNEPAATFLMNVHSELMTDRNTAFSQPYYSRHPYVHLRRGEVKPFLKAYYNTAAALADRETYTFYEHFYGVSPHKTHEEGWFLMETRWMLYMEKGDTLRLLPGIPRSYFEDGKRIRLDQVSSYFGPLTLDVRSDLKEDVVVANITVDTDRKPRVVEIRLPHPQGRKAVRVQGGTYDPTAELVRIEPFTGQAEVRIGFSNPAP